MWASRRYVGSTGWLRFSWWRLRVLVLGRALLRADLSAALLWLAHIAAVCGMVVALTLVVLRVEGIVAAALNGRHGTSAASSLGGGGIALDMSRGAEPSTSFLWCDEWDMQPLCLLRNVRIDPRRQEIRLLQTQPLPQHMGDLELPIHVAESRDRDGNGPGTNNGTTATTRLILVRWPCDDSKKTNVTEQLTCVLIAAATARVRILGPSAMASLSAPVVVVLTSDVARPAARDGSNRVALLEQMVRPHRVAWWDELPAAVYSSVAIGRKDPATTVPYNAVVDLWWSWSAAAGLGARAAQASSTTTFSPVEIMQLSDFGTHMLGTGSPAKLLQVLMARWQPPTIKVLIASHDLPRDVARLAAILMRPHQTLITMWTSRELEGIVQQRNGTLLVVPSTSLHLEPDHALLYAQWLGDMRAHHGGRTRFLLYMPWEQLGNQMRAFSSACALSIITERVLVLPMVGYRSAGAGRSAEAAMVFNPRLYTWGEFERYFDLDAAIESLPCSFIDSRNFMRLYRRDGLAMSVRYHAVGPDTSPGQLVGYYKDVLRIRTLESSIAHDSVNYELTHDKLRKLHGSDTSDVLALGTLYHYYDFGVRRKHPIERHYDYMAHSGYAQTQRGFVASDRVRIAAAAVVQQLYPNAAPFACVHVRRGDVAEKCKFHVDMPALYELCMMPVPVLLQTLSKHVLPEGISNVFIATSPSAKPSEFGPLTKMGFNIVVSHIATANVSAALFLDPIEGALLDQTICSHHANLFVGGFFSSFSTRIAEQRRVLTRASVIL